MPKDVASYWTGQNPLHYINHICLASFVEHGHKVTLYLAPERMEGFEAPKGVILASSDEIMPDFSAKTMGILPATAADLFRVLLISQKDVVWIDTDAYCVKPFPDDLFYIFGTEAPEKILSSHAGNLNNGVLGLPRDSKALHFLRQFSLKTLGQIDEVDPEVQAYIDGGTGHAILKYGPRAVTHFLGLTGELKYQLEPHALYPVHFNLSDCIWDPLVDVEDRFMEDTLSLHIWGSQVRPGWYRRRALRGSFMWKAAKRLDINMQKYTYRKS